MIFVFSIRNSALSVGIQSSKRQNQIEINGRKEFVPKTTEESVIYGVFSSVKQQIVEKFNQIDQITEEIVKRAMIEKDLNPRMYAEVNKFDEIIQLMEER